MIVRNSLLVVEVHCGAFGTLLKDSGIAPHVRAKKYINIETFSRESCHLYLKHKNNTKQKRSKSSGKTFTPNPTKYHQDVHPYRA